MAQKESNPRAIFANDITSSMGNTALTYRNKAPNDKTYSATILGVNRKFTDDVTEDDITNKLAKFNIPETVGEGEDNYYTFKINGEYYCKQQTGNFKLYDEILVYMPNNNWSNMYFDYADGVSHNSGGGGGSDTELPDYIVSPDMPGGDDRNIGDLWIVTNDETITEFTNLTEDTFVNMYEYKADENEVIDWRLVKVCIAEASSKVDVINDDYWIKTDENNVFTEIDMWETSGSTTSFYEIYPNPERETNPKVIINIKKPMKEGDCWIDIDNKNDKNIESFNQYVYNKETSQFNWETVFNVKSGESRGLWIQPYQPHELTENDLLVSLNSDGTIVTALYRYNGTSWISQNFTQGTESPNPPTQPSYDSWYCYFPDGQLRLVMGYINNESRGYTWLQAYAYDYKPDNSANKFYRNKITVPKKGDVWIKLKSAVSQNAIAAYTYGTYATGLWTKECDFGTGSEISLGNGLQYDSNGKLTLKLGDGLAFNQNGNLICTVEPVVNIANALVYKKEQN